MVPPIIPDPSRALDLELEEAKHFNVRPVTSDLPWSPSETTPNPSDGPSPAPWEVSPAVISPDLPVMAMLRAPKLWLLSQEPPTPLPTEASGAKGHSVAMATAPPSPASETEASPQDPIHPEVYSLPSSSGLAGQDGESTSLSLSSHGGGSPPAPSQAAIDTQAGASPNSPGVDFGETRGASPTELSKAEHPRSSPQASVDGNVVADITISETATEPLGARGVSESESGVFNIAESPTSSLQASMDKMQGTWASLHRGGLDPHSLSAPLGVPEVSLMPKVTPRSGPWAATDGGVTVDPMDSTVTLDTSDAGGHWEPGPHMIEGAESPTLSPQMAMDTSVVTSLKPLDLGDKVGVLSPFTVASSSSRPHPDPEGQLVTQGTLGAVEPPQEGSHSGDPILPPWTSTAANKDEPVSVSSGEPTVPWDSPSTLPPASLGPEEFELEVLAGSPGVESFWEEAASGEEPALPGTPANGSAEEGESEARGLVQATVLVLRDLGLGGGIVLGAWEGF